MRAFCSGGIAYPGSVWYNIVKAIFKEKTMYTSYNIGKLSEIFAEPRSVYFIGIGGISMSSLAHIAHDRGCRVGGYDRTPSRLTKAL